MPFKYATLILFVISFCPITGQESQIKCPALPAPRPQKNVILECFFKSSNANANSQNSGTGTGRDIDANPTGEKFRRWNCSANASPVGTVARYGCLDKFYKPALPDSSASGGRTGSLTRKYLVCLTSGRWSRFAAFQEFSCHLDCGQPTRRHNPLITFGEETTRYSWPWHVALFIHFKARGRGESTLPRYSCGGSLLSKSIVVTAAHCLTMGGRGGGTPRKPESILVVLGAVSSDFQANLEDPHAQIRKVRNVYVSDEYHSKDLQSDIGILELSELADINEFVSPVCFPFVSGQGRNLIELNFEDGKSGEVVGFGNTQTGTLAKTLQYTSLPMIGKKQCFDSLGVVPNNAQFCAGTSNGTSVCNGDSGGGMVIEEVTTFTQKYYIQGLVSFGDRKNRETICENFAVFTKIYKFSDWVAKIMEDAEKIVNENSSSGQELQVENTKNAVRPIAPNPKPKTKLIAIFRGGENNYSDVLRGSLLFYEAQRSGELPSSNRISWRKSAMIDTDSGLAGEDLSGGYFTSGSYVKFGFPTAATATLIAWGLIDFRDGYDAAGELEHGLEALKWFTDYFIKSHISAYAFYIQVGDPKLEDKSWCHPEDWTPKRPALKISTAKPGSEVAAETAAALAASAIVFAEHGDLSYSQECLRHAEELYEFANLFRGKYTESFPSIKEYYNSYTGYGDELGWAAAWLFLATNKSSYMNDVRSHWEEFKLSEIPHDFSWDWKTAGLQVLLAQIDGAQLYRNAAKDFCSWVLGSAPRTPKGLVYLEDWGPLFHAGNVAFLCLEVAELGIDVEANVLFAKQQIDYILGSSGQSFVVGFGPKSPVRAHHRASSCPLQPNICDWSHFSSPRPNPQAVTGAVVGGPDEKDTYQDVRSDYVKNQVSIYYNAGFQSALASLVSLRGRAKI